MNREQFDKYAEMDDAVVKYADGAFVEPEYNGPKYDFRAIRAYCRERGIDPKQLSEEEFKKFEIN